MVNGTIRFILKANANCKLYLCAVPKQGMEEVRMKPTGRTGTNM